MRPQPSAASTAALAAACALAILAGCAAPAPLDPGTTPPTPPATSSPPTSTSPGAGDALRGLVVDAAIRPVAGAAVRLVHEDRTTATDGGGRFEFEGVGPGRHALQVHAPGFLLANTSGMAGEEVRIVLEPAPSNASYQLAYKFRGNMQCAFEALIISPSCDSALVMVPDEEKPLLTNQSFPFGVDLGWRTLVVDVRFDARHPLLDGLRIAVRGARAPEGGGDYEQFGRWHDATSYTVRLEPGGTYPDGTGPVPGNFTGFRVDVYPHGKAYHELCAADSCFLGAGAGIDVTFELYVTAFHGEPAPAGFTMLARA